MVALGTEKGRSPSLTHIIALGLEEVELEGDAVLGGGHQLPDAVFIGGILLGPARAGDGAVEFGEETSTGGCRAGPTQGPSTPWGWEHHKGHRERGRYFGGGSQGSLTLAAAFVGCQLVARVTGTFVAAQGVDTALLAAAVVGAGALVHLWAGKGRGGGEWPGGL